MNVRQQNYSSAKPALLPRFFTRVTSVSTFTILICMTGLQLLWYALTWYIAPWSGASTLLVLAGLAVVSLAVVALISDDILARAGKWFQRQIANERRALALLTVFAFVPGLYYVLNQRIWPYDEEFSFEGARIVASEGLASFFAQYGSVPWLGSQHPPLTPLLNGLALRLFGTELVVIRLVSLAFTLGTIILVYYLGKMLYGREIGFLSAALLLSFPLFLRTGTSGLIDMHVTFFFNLAVLMTLKLRESASWSTAIVLGLAVGLGTLSKYTMGIIGPFLVLLFLLDRQLRSRFPYLVVAVLIAAALISTWLTFAYQQGILYQQRGLAQIEPGWLLVNASGLEWLSTTLVTRLPSAIGVQNIPLLFLGVLAIIARRGRREWLLIIWVVSVAVTLIMTLPDHRYFLPIFPALSMIISIWLVDNRERAPRPAILSLLLAAGALTFFLSWLRFA